MKVRVKQIGELFYPQYKKIFFWENFKSLKSYDYYESVRFTRMEDALKYARNSIVTIHKA